MKHQNSFVVPAGFLSMDKNPISLKAYNFSYFTMDALLVLYIALCPL